MARSQGSVVTVPPGGDSRVAWHDRNLQGVDDTCVEEKGVRQRLRCSRSGRGRRSSYKPMSSSVAALRPGRGGGVMAPSRVVTTWLAPGEGTRQLAHLTGRAPARDPLLAFPRDRFKVTFGTRLSKDSFNGPAIDGNWLASCGSQGISDVVDAKALVFLPAAGVPAGVRARNPTSVNDATHPGRFAARTIRPGPEVVIRVLT